MNIWHIIGLIAYAVSGGILFIAVPACILSLLGDIIVSYRRNNMQWKTALQNFLILSFKVFTMFVFCYGTYALTTGKTELPYIQVLLSYF